MNSGTISIIGRPNVGKSTLLNQIIGEKIAAVSPKPQTTRNRIMGVKTLPEGQLIFLDTPGIHKPFNRMHEKMVHVALTQMDGIDTILLVVDASSPFGKGDAFVLERLKEKATVPVVLALNKIDLVRKPKLLPLISQYSETLNPAAIVPISAQKGDGIDLLEEELLKLLPEGDLLYPADTLTDQTERAFVAEIIREKVFLNTEREIPFSTAVFIDAFEEEENRLFIAASIMLEKGGQKAIVIGKGGQMLKKIGTEARLELQKILDTRIHLELHVKVRDNWRENERILNELGI